MSRFKKAIRTQARLRLGLDGPPGSGKSYTALRLAHCFPEARIACIEAGEHRRLNLYIGEEPDGIPFAFELTELGGNYSPSEYTAAIEDAGREKFDILIIDSLSHAWTGTGGALEQVGSSSFTDKDGWHRVTPQHNRMIDAILQSPCHVIVTLRTKIEYVLEEHTNEKGKTVKVPRKVGMAPIQRTGIEYEFDLYGSIDHTHTLTITKSRCPAMQDTIHYKPGPVMMTPLLAWLSTGDAVSLPDVPSRVGPEQLQRINDLIKETGLPQQKFTKGLEKYGVSSYREFTPPQADEFETTVRQWLEGRREKEAKVSAEIKAAVATL